MINRSDVMLSFQVKWINKQRVLVFASRGINHRDRHLMEDIKTLMPHHRTEAKMERSKNLQVVNEICEVKNCNKSILFEGRKKRDLYMWFSNVPTGPSAKFLVENSMYSQNLSFRRTISTRLLPLIQDILSHLDKCLK